MLYLLMTAALGQTAADADGVDEILAAEVLGFREGQAEPTSTAPLDEVAELLRLHGDLRVEVGGHTARHDDAAADQAVSQRRADAVVAALVARGVSADRLTARGYGSTVSLFSNRTPEGRSQNERVQFRAIREGVLDV